MLYIDNESGNPIIETVKKAFSDKKPVTLVIECDGKLLNIPSYMSELIIPNGPPFELNIRIQSSQEPIWIYTEADKIDDNNDPAPTIVRPDDYHKWK